MRRTLVLPILLATASTACTRPPDDQAVYDAMPRLALTPLAEVCAGRDDEPCQFVNAAVVAPAPDGRVAIADMMGELREFGRDGGYLRTIGARGGGPGEYRRLVTAGYDSSGGMTILDQAGLRVQRFDSTGALLDATTAPLIPGLVGVAVAEGRVALLALPGADAVGDTVEAYAVLVDPATGDTTTLPGAPEPAIATGDGTMFPIQPLFRVLPMERWAVSPDGAFHLGDRDRLRIVCRDATGSPPRAIVDLAVAPRPVTAEDVEAELAKRGPLGPPPNAAVAAQLRRQLDEAAANAATEHPFVSRLVILADGTLLAREGTGAQADSTRWNAFAADGDPIGHLVLPAYARVAGGRLERLLVATPGEDDVPRIAWCSAERAGSPAADR